MKYFARCPQMMAKEINIFDNFSVVDLPVSFNVKYFVTFAKIRQQKGFGTIQIVRITFFFYKKNNCTCRSDATKSSSQYVGIFLAFLRVL